MNVKTVNRSTVAINGTLGSLANTLTLLADHGDIPMGALIHEADVSLTSEWSFGEPEKVVNSTVTLTFEWPAS